MQRFFHDELRQLRDDLILMGERSLDMSRLVLRAIETGDQLGIRYELPASQRSGRDTFKSMIALARVMAMYCIERKEV